MKKATALAAVLFLAFVTSAFGDDGMQIKIDNYSITIPSLWLAQRTDSATVFILYSPIEENDTFQENVNLTVEKLPSKYSIKAGREVLKKLYANFKLIEEGDDYQIFSGELNGIALQQMQFVSISGTEAYVLTFSSTPEDFDRYADTFKAIYSTFTY
ncbi:hypothetical protein [Treponema sp. Marseille-Q4130]|uniref:hypothetical protein n=1 Tax=Treponema sp. Marseille-Q4130 TaxID=2766702 RepID=UPI001652234A|nr:hypothetical protein [Treponema sp. Marseille-Q4130]MBC6719480.1 hypothetical protein [Treponema sp. Marseille-Q4130]